MNLKLAIALGQGECTEGTHTAPASLQKPCSALGHVTRTLRNSSQASIHTNQVSSESLSPFQVLVHDHM